MHILCKPWPVQGFCLMGPGGAGQKVALDPKKPLPHGGCRVKTFESLITHPFTESVMSKQIYNFCAGPAMLPVEVMERAQREF
jgi:hypothetical protein